MKTHSILKALSLQLSLATYASAFRLPGSENLEVRDTDFGVVLPPGWAYLGCFTDQTDPQRTLSTQTTLYGLDVTVELCVNTCIGLGFGYAGVESGFQCFCGDATASPGVPTDTGCDISCAGNNAEICGGALRLNVYVNQAVNGPSPPPVTTTSSATPTSSSTSASSSPTTIVTTTSATSTTSTPVPSPSPVPAPDPAPAPAPAPKGDKGGIHGGSAGKGGSQGGSQGGSGDKGGSQGGGKGQGGQGGGAGGKGGSGGSGGHGGAGGKGGRPPTH